MDGTSRWVGGVVAVLVFAALGVGFWSQARGDVGPGSLVAARTPAAASQSSEPERAPATAAPPPSEPSEPSEHSEAPAAAEPEGTSAPEPEPTPGPEEAGPAEGPWAELLPAARVSHPETDPDTAFPWDLVGYFREGDPRGDQQGNPSGDWSNKAELWDQLAPPLRGQVAALGQATSDPVWPEATPNEARGQTRWSHETTGGRGELVELLAQYRNGEGEIIDRVQAALIVTASDGTGRIHATMSPFELRKVDYPGFVAYDEAVAALEWEWVQQQESS